MAETTSERPALLAAFAGRPRELAGREPAWLTELRRRALERFEEVGFPTSRVEAWRNTSVKAVAGTPFAPAPARVDLDRARESLQRSGLAGISRRRLVLVNGRYRPELSELDGLPPGAVVGSLGRVLAERPGELEGRLGAVGPFSEHAFAALNTAFFEDGALVALPPDLRLAEPLAIVHLIEPSAGPIAVWPRTLVLAGRGSEASVLACFAAAGEGDASCLDSALTEIVVEDNASIHHHRLQLDDGACSHLGVLYARQGRDARLVSHNYDLGAALGRLDTTVVLDGEGGWCQLNGLYLTAAEQHIDNHTTLEHASAHCQSRELYKGILAERSRAVFNGRIVVRPGAQKTDAKQSNPNLLLSRDALVHTRPQLEIYADDVKCTHGATIGRLDGEALFYLRSRGIGATDARKMLVRAFAGEVIERVALPGLREWIEAAVAARLDRIEDGTGV